MIASGEYAKHSTFGSLIWWIAGFVSVVLFWPACFPLFTKAVLSDPKQIKKNSVRLIVIGIAVFFGVAIGLMIRGKTPTVSLADTVVQIWLLQYLIPGPFIVFQGYRLFERSERYRAYAELLQKDPHVSLERLAQITNHTPRRVAADLRYMKSAALLSEPV